MFLFLNFVNLMVLNFYADGEWKSMLARFHKWVLLNKCVLLSKSESMEWTWIIFGAPLDLPKGVHVHKRAPCNSFVLTTGKQKRKELDQLAECGTTELHWWKEALTFDLWYTCGILDTWNTIDQLPSPTIINGYMFVTCNVLVNTPFDLWLVGKIPSYILGSHNGHRGSF